MILIGGWILLCIVFLVWSTGNLDAVLRRTRRETGGFLYWLKGRK